MRTYSGAGIRAKSASLQFRHFRNNAPAAPVRAPNSTNHGSCVSRVNSNTGASNQWLIPKKVRETTEATTDDTSTGANRFIEKLPKTIWAAKTAPLMGAL